MSNVIQATISNEKGSTVISLPFKGRESTHSIGGLLRLLGIEDVFNQECRVESISSSCMAFDCLEGQVVNVGKLDRLATWVDSMTQAGQYTFFAALEVTGAEDIGQMEKVLDALNDFTLYPGVRNAEDYGKYMIRSSGKYGFDESLEFFYNYEAFGEFLMAHEDGRITQYGYLKCDDDSTFLDFFASDHTEQQRAKEGITMEMGGGMA